MAKIEIQTYDRTLALVDKALEEQQYILKSAAGELNNTDKKAFEQTISKYIKEIDKCIALLSE